MILISPSTTSCGRSEHNLCFLLPQNSTSCGFLIHFLPQVVLFYHNLCSVFYHNLCSFLPQVVLSRILRRTHVVLSTTTCVLRTGTTCASSTTTCGRSEHNLCSFYHKIAQLVVAQVVLFCGRILPQNTTSCAPFYHKTPQLVLLRSQNTTTCAFLDHNLCCFVLEVYQ